MDEKTEADRWVRTPVLRPGVAQHVSPDRQRDVAERFVSDIHHALSKICVQVGPHTFYGRIAWEAVDDGQVEDE